MEVGIIHWQLSGSTNTKGAQSENAGGGALWGGGGCTDERLVEVGHNFK